jgi:signal transduction histidine kinase
MGLFIIEERAKAIKGDFRIHSEPDLGTEVHLEVPMGGQ